MSNVLCSLRDVSVAYQGKDVLRGISFDVNCGNMIAFIGANGAGKSTLLKAMVGLLLYRGSIQLQCQQTEISYLSQLNTAARDFPATVYEVVHSGRQRKGRLFCRREDHEVVEQSLEMLGIAQLRHRAISRLSGGQMQRVRLARALCAQPKLLVLDEPTDGLDADTSAQLYALLRHWNQQMNVSICMATHDHSGMARVAKRVIKIEDGMLHEHTV